MCVQIREGIKFCLDFIFDTKARNEKVSTEDLPQVIRELSILSLVFTYYRIMVS